MPIETIPNWAVIFEDQDYEIVYFDDELSARKFYELKKGYWTCYLFKRIKSSVELTKTS